MTKQSDSELSQRFQNFTNRILQRKTIESVRLEGRFFRRRTDNPLARIQREDFMTPTSLGATTGLLEIQWAAVRTGRAWNRHYYLVSVRVVGSLETQQMHYELIEYRFAGIGKFRRDPLRRTRVVNLDELYDPTELKCLDTTDKGWTGNERRFDRIKTLASFDDHLHF